MKAVCAEAGSAQREAQWVRQTAKAGDGRALRSPKHNLFLQQEPQGDPLNEVEGADGAVGTQTPTK